MWGNTFVFRSSRLQNATTYYRTSSAHGMQKSMLKVYSPMVDRLAARIPVQWIRNRTLIGEPTLAHLDNHSEERLHHRQS